MFTAIVNTVAQFLISGRGARNNPVLPEIVGHESAGPLLSIPAITVSDLTGKRGGDRRPRQRDQTVPEIAGQGRRTSALSAHPAGWSWHQRRGCRVAGRYRPRVMGHCCASASTGPGMTKRPNTLKIIGAPGRQLSTGEGSRAARKLTPRYRIGCKRILNSSTYSAANLKTS